MVFIESGKELKCPICRFTVIELISVGLTTHLKERYPDGLCRKCKREVMNELRARCGLEVRK